MFMKEDNTICKTIDNSDLFVLVGRSINNIIKAVQISIVPIAFKSNFLFEFGLNIFYIESSGADIDIGKSFYPNGFN